MKDLEPRDVLYVLAARHSLESGHPLAAQRELEKIGERFQSHPDVLEIQWAIQCQGRNWENCLEIADAIVSSAPERPTGWIKRSFVLHQLNRTQEALDSLFPAVEKFPEIPIIPYNLACYAAQLQSLWEAERWLKQAVDIGGNPYKNLALRDRELEALAAKIPNL